jgi:hypothetical protein
MLRDELKISLPQNVQAKHSTFNLTLPLIPASASFLIGGSYCVHLDVIAHQSVFAESGRQCPRS